MTGHYLYIYGYRRHLYLHSFPTRRSSDLRLTDSAVILEFGFKSEGSVPREEFKDAPQIGEDVEVLLESLEDDDRSEEHTSELQSPCNLVCSLLLEKKHK